jgi:hypothetical protein
MVLLFAVLGIAAIVAGIVIGGVALAACLMLGLFLWSMAAYVHLTWLAPAHPEKRTPRVDTPDGGRDPH